MANKIQMISGLAFGLFAGALIGSGAALLTAPQNGARTRALLKEKGDDLRARAVESLEQTRVKAESVLSEVRTRSEGFVEAHRNHGSVHNSQEILAE